MTKLKPCPFCGSDEIGREDFASGGALVSLLCLNCGAIGPIAYALDEAFTKWNRRADQPQRIDGNPAGITAEQFDAIYEATDGNCKR